MSKEKLTHRRSHSHSSRSHEPMADRSGMACNARSLHRPCCACSRRWSENLVFFHEIYFECAHCMALEHYKASA